MGETMNDPIYKKGYDILLKYRYLGKSFLNEEISLYTDLSEEMPTLYSKELFNLLSQYYPLNKEYMKEMIFALDLLVVALPDNIKIYFPDEIQNISSLIRQRYARKFKESPYL